MKLFPPSALTQEIWDSALLTRPDRHFLQSWLWGEFQSKLGNPIWRLAVEHDGEIINQLLILRLSLGLGWNILYSPRGSIINKRLSAQLQQDSSKLLLQEIKRLGATTKTILFRIDPNAFIHDSIALSLYRSHHFIANPHKNIQPRQTQTINLSQGEEALLKQMKPKTRYNIRLATRHGVGVSRSTNPQDIETFINLTKTTAERDNFIPHSANYYRTQFSILAPAGMQELFIASKDQTPLAAVLVTYFGTTAIYTHGASASTGRELMAPHLLQFAAMITAKDKGITTYDFWGIHPDPKHSWAGITRFKQGFGGQAVEYIGTFEFPLIPSLYKIYSFINRFR